MNEVSVLFSVHNGAGFLRRSVESVLDQQGVDFELILIDDGSTDGTWEIIQSFADQRVRKIRNERNLGLAASLNKALALARHELVARMDADDLSLPGRLAAQVAVLVESRAEICFCRYEYQAVQGPVVWREASPLVRRWQCLFVNGFGAHPAAMFKKSPVLALGGYDETLHCAQDYDLWDRAQAAGLRFVYAPQVGLRYGCDASALSRQRREDQLAVARKVGRRALARAFGDASDDEIAGLRHLMSYLPNEAASQAQLDEALARLPGRLDGFVQGAPACERRRLWGEASTRAAYLARRTPDRQRAAVRSFALGASMRALSPRAWLRASFA